LQSKTPKILARDRNFEGGGEKRANGCPERRTIKTSFLRKNIGFEKKRVQRASVLDNPSGEGEKHEGLSGRSVAQWRFVSINVRGS